MPIRGGYAVGGLPYGISAMPMRRGLIETGGESEATGHPAAGSVRIVVMGSDSEAAREEWWQTLTRQAEADDAAYDPAKTWVPPIVGALFRAAYRSPLREFVPFTSMNRLCFSRQPWAPGWDCVPAFVAFGPPWQYYVCAGDPYETYERVLTTPDAAAAVRQVVALLDTTRPGSV